MTLRGAAVAAGVVGAILAVFFAAYVFFSFPQAADAGLQALYAFFVSPAILVCSLAMLVKQLRRGPAIAALVLGGVLLALAISVVLGGDVIGGGGLAFSALLVLLGGGLGFRVGVYKP